MPRSVAVLLALSLVLGACGADESPEAPEVTRAEETPESLPELPRGFVAYANLAAGLTVGRPPGWAAAERGVATELTSPDELVVMRITVDRSSAALAAEPGQFASRTLAALSGFGEEAVEPSRPRPFGHRYDAAQVRGEARAQTGVRQRIRVIALERDGVAMATAVVFENADEAAGGQVRQALVAVRTLRTQPPG